MPLFACLCLFVCLTLSSSLAPPLGYASRVCLCLFCMLQCPCVLDIKLGPRSYDESASQVCACVCVRVCVRAPGSARPVALSLDLWNRESACVCVSSSLRGFILSRFKSISHV